MPIWYILEVAKSIDSKDSQRTSWLTLPILARVLDCVLCWRIPGARGQSELQIPAALNEKKRGMVPYVLQVCLRRFLSLSCLLLIFVQTAEEIYQRTLTLCCDWADAFQAHHSATMNKLDTDAALFEGLNKFWAMSTYGTPAFNITLAAIALRYLLQVVSGPNLLLSK